MPGSSLAADAGTAAAQQPAASKAVPPAMQVGNRRPSLAEAALAGRQAAARRPSVAEAASVAGRTQPMPGAGTQGQRQPQQGRQHLTALLLLEGPAVFLVRANHDLLRVSLPSADVAAAGSAGTAEQAGPQQMPADQREPQHPSFAAFHDGPTRSPRSTDRPRQVAAFLTPPLEAAGEDAPRQHIYRGHKVSPTAAGCCSRRQTGSMFLPWHTPGPLPWGPLSAWMLRQSEDSQQWTAACEPLAGGACRAGSSSMGRDGVSGAVDTGWGRHTATVAWCTS